MTLQIPEIRALLRRATRSMLRGYQIALGDQYAQALGGSDGSPAGLVALCEKALADTAEPVVPPSPIDEAPPSDNAPPTLVPPPPVSSPPPAVELAAPVEEAPVEVPVEEAAADDAEEETEAEAEDAGEAETSDVAKEPGTSKSRRRRRK